MSMAKVHCSCGTPMCSSNGYIPVAKDRKHKPHFKTRGNKPEPIRFGGFSKYNPPCHDSAVKKCKKKRKQASALKIMAELGSESNAHGLAKIVTSVTTKRKVLWSLLVIIGFTAATLQLSFLVTKFLAYQVVEVSQMKEGMPVEFPAVTLCNIATISLTKVNELIARNNTDIMKWFTFIQNTNFGEQDERMDSHQAFYENMPDVAKYIGHSAENFVVSCRFNTKECSASNFSIYFDGKNYFNCYTFNSGYDNKLNKPIKDKLLMHTTGPQNGLSLIISLDNENPPAGGYGLYDIKNHIAFSGGVRGQVHAPNTMPSPADHGFDVAPGYSTSVGLKAILHTRLPYPHGNCTNNMLQGDKLYRNTIFTCLQLCKQKILVNWCGCKTAALPMYRETDPKKGNIPFCGAIKNWRNIDAYTNKSKVEIDTLQCAERVLTNLNNDRSYEKNCNCFQPCDETSYQKSLSLSYWPLEFYQLSALKKFYKNHSMTTSLIREAYDKLNNLQNRWDQYLGENRHVEYNQSDLDDKIRASTIIRQNLIRLNIYLEDLSVVEFKQMPAYGITDLFADIGGTLGLWMGISVLTIMELVELIMSLILLLFDSEEDQGESNLEQEQAERQSMLNPKNHSVMHDSNYSPNHHNTITQDSKYNHFHYERPVYNQPLDRHAESPI
ncbi:FMRFamide-activated amiloride-sensitive sodium channel-like isoform X2 [Mya arenaria]|uniref:FMRFamide-activated amiloride-sensitive sodium channel-like isoform X2 n=1 Tax=Mya arenaria TaxID=6604 RepID=UPI0022E1D233|nr:FMRFamide-activated amiloride-sensitive sodium channel-like isoform X2 [Mya arenaria]XP_052780064.1 FMRFamide-activated amiloride-sensitive sodium channel-like isoform X2 [Mya arenaria]